LKEERENREGGSVGGKGERSGVFGKTALSFPFLGPEQRRGEGSSGVAGRRRLPASRATAAAGRRGKMERATRGIDSHPHLGSGRREEAASQAAADWWWRC
jgi:hypothetical protein